MCSQGRIPGWYSMFRAGAESRASTGMVLLLGPRIFDKGCKVFRIGNI